MEQDAAKQAGVEELTFDPRRMTRIYDEVLKSRRDLVNGAVDRVMAAVRTMPCAREHMHEVEVALTEALANAVIHGNREDPSKRVRLSAWCAEQEHLLLAVTDEGEGFDPACLPDPTLAENIFATHGRGIYMISKLMDGAEYRLGGRQVLMRKRVARFPDEGEADSS